MSYVLVYDDNLGGFSIKKAIKKVKKAVRKVEKITDPIKESKLGKFLHDTNSVKVMHVDVVKKTGKSLRTGSSKLKSRGRVMAHDLKTGNVKGLVKEIEVQTRTGYQEVGKDFGHEGEFLKKADPYTRLAVEAKEKKAAAAEKLAYEKEQIAKLYGEQEAAEFFLPLLQQYLKQGGASDQQIQQQMRQESFDQNDGLPDALILQNRQINAARQKNDDMALTFFSLSVTALLLLYKFRS